MKAFYAYPSSIADVTQVIHAAKRTLSATRRDLDLQLWEENDISGRPLTDPIFEGIAGADILVADITAMNFNVTFEIGYAIGLGKRIYRTRLGQNLQPPGGHSEFHRNIRTAYHGASSGGQSPSTPKRQFFG